MCLSCYVLLGSSQMIKMNNLTTDKNLIFGKITLLNLKSMLLSKKTCIYVL